MSQRDSAGDRRSEQRSRAGSASERQADRAEQRGRAESRSERRMDRAEQRDRQRQDRTTGQGASREDARDRDRQSTQRDQTQRSQSRQDQARQDQQRQDQQRQSSQRDQRQQSETTGSAQGQAAANTQGGRTLSAQQQTRIRSSVLSARNAPRVSASNINFRVNVGVAVPRSFRVASVATFPVLIDLYPQYRRYSFFVVEDEIVFLDDDREIVEVVAVGPRTRFSGGGRYGASSTIAVDLSREEIIEVQRVLIARGFLTGRADGVWSTRVRDAVVSFQRRQGITVSGSIDTRTVSAMGLSGRVTAQGAGGGRASTTGSGSQQPAAQDSRSDSRRGGSAASGGQGGAAQQQPQASDRGATGQGTNRSERSNQPAAAQSGNRSGSSAGTTGQGTREGNDRANRRPAQSGSGMDQPSR